MTSISTAVASRRRSRWRWVAAATAATALAVTAVALIVELSGIDARIPDGVRVDGVDVAGLSSPELERTIERHARARAARPVLLVGPLRTLRTTGIELGARADVAGAVAAANATRVGRSGAGSGTARSASLRSRSTSTRRGCPSTPRGSARCRRGMRQ
jgi:hypothetical protein